MTSEQLEALAREACLIPQILRNAADHSPDCLQCDAIFSALQRVASEIRQQMVEEACKAVCLLCAGGDVPTHYPPDSQIKGSGPMSVHRTKLTVDQCPAGFIWALSWTPRRILLLQEPSESLT